ncbi:MAG: ATP-dependent zinc metalloprotease FtsH [Bacteroidales bacterium]|jgi:cell division protease FtsH|nr:ATP-dependent zinc metalloprotease FtsH [Bacteroidales bacterium]
MAAEKDINKQAEAAEKEKFIKFGSNNGDGEKRGFHFNIFYVYLLIGGFLVYMYMSSDGNTQRTIDYSQFQQLTKQGFFDKVVVDAREAEATATLSKDPGEAFPALSDAFKQTAATNNRVVLQSNLPSCDRFAEEVEIWKSAEGSQCSNLDVRYERNSTLRDLLYNFGPLLLMIIFFWFFFLRNISSSMGERGGGPFGIFNVGRSKAMVFDKDNKMKVTFQDVAGLSEAKQEVQEIVEFLKNPERYTNLGGKIPKGALLVGPPGTGKTLLAKAVAGEADVPFFSMSGSDFVEMFVGVGASRVRDLFRQAKEKSPCIIFIDEIDAVGRARSTRNFSGGNDERENTLNQLLTEMDGFGTNSGVIILAATNRADMLDKALLRAGRFDRQIAVDLPELNDRVEIFKVHLKPLHLAKNIDIKKLARQTPGFSGADIANVCNEAALIAARANKKRVEAADFNNAVDRIIGGLEKKSKIMTQEEKHSIAIHEAGHATISWHLQYAAPLVKVTIVPRGKALGAAWYMPEERQISTKEAMCDELCSLLGGRAAEELFIGHISSGAANDLERVTKQAYAMVAYYGMSKRLPNVCYYDSTGQDYGFSKPYSDERARVIDEEVSALISEQYERAKTLLKTYADGHGLLTQRLEEKEVIFTEDVIEIFGERQWTSRTDELMKTKK